jgi:hypothetical protein
MMNVNLNNVNNSYVIDNNIQTPKTNGRVNLEAQENGTPFFIQDAIPKKERTNYYNATQHMLSSSLLSNTFFSLENIEIIQNAIRAEIYKKSNNTYIIDNQDYDQIKIIMRSVFLQYALHRDDNIRGQIEDLNKVVLDFCVPQVYSELVSYMKYKKDISTLPVPMDNPTYFSNDKTMELNNFF